ncbi:hypothetical protein Nepgr_001769 [Nepenthes gracilis]|uniref:Uncharacterized protein n=1 Tax=Nepenthes gracilis TaxID=150966 RepID=A0AAD3RY00_NEPGR|nr:hypothetical protein Nepgr_001769 [Nepenthes gracilis]
MASIFLHKNRHNNLTFLDTGLLGLNLRGERSIPLRGTSCSSQDCPDPSASGRQTAWTLPFPRTSELDLGPGTPLNLGLTNFAQEEYKGCPYA